MAATEILVVEDHIDARDLVIEWLDSTGHRASGASNGAEALELLRAGARPRIIFLDLMMPVMDGWTFMRQALAEGLLKHTQVWVVSAAEGMAPPQGIEGFIPKPVELSKLDAALRHAHRPQRRAG